MIFFKSKSAALQNNPNIIPSITDAHEKWSQELLEQQRQQILRDKNWMQHNRLLKFI